MNTLFNFLFFPLNFVILLLIMEKLYVGVGRYFFIDNTCGLVGLWGLTSLSTIFQLYRH